MVTVEVEVEVAIEVEVEVTRKWRNCFSDAKKSIAAPSCAVLDFATTETATTRRSHPHFLLIGISSLMIISNLRRVATWSEVVHDRG
jgi:hypothetical protein